MVARTTTQLRYVFSASDAASVENVRLGANDGGNINRETRSGRVELPSACAQRSRLSRWNNLSKVNRPAEAMAPVQSAVKEARSPNAGKRQQVVPGVGAGFGCRCVSFCSSAATATSMPSRWIDQDNAVLGHSQTDAGVPIQQQQTNAPSTNPTHLDIALSAEAQPSSWRALLLVVV
jgi:hypothetical protein